MSKYLVLCTEVYSFTAEDTGDVIRGAYLHCCDTEPEKMKGRVGSKPVRLPLSIEKANEFTTVPGIYDLEIKLSPNKDGKSYARCGGGTLVKPLDY